MSQPPLTSASEPVRESSTRFAALRNREARVYITGASLTMGGDSVEHAITYWVLFQQFHSPALAGFAIISHWIPSLFSVYFGGLADRYDCRKIIQFGNLLFMSVSVIWGVLIVTDSLQVWHALVLLSMHGLAGAVMLPAEQLMLHDLVGREDLPSAVRLNSTGRSIGFLGGPAIGSVLLLLLGPPAIFLNVLMYLPLSIWALRTPYTGHVRDGGVRSSQRVSLFDAVGVLRQVVGQPVLVSLIVLGGLSSFLIGSGIQAQMPEYAADLGVGGAEAGYGVLLAANAGGAVLGGLLLESTHWLRTTVRAALLSTLVWAACMLGFAISGNYPLSVLLLVAAGMANLGATSIAQTLVQLLAPAGLRGRVVGVYNVFSSGLRAGSGLTIGVVGGFIGIHWSLGLSSALLVLTVIGLLLFTSRAAARDVEANQQAPSTV